MDGGEEVIGWGRRLWPLLGAVGCSAVSATTERCWGRSTDWHTDVIATVFWVGEKPSPDNRYIGNDSSAWTSRWTDAFGGVDDPVRRDGFHPAGFVPLENPFYVALPYNDLGPGGHHRAEVDELVPWAVEGELERGRSVLKNRWVELRRGDRRCFGQWEDVGPYVEDDAAYVFGHAAPANDVTPSAGIDVSPAIRDCLGMDAVATVCWRFVEASEVPNGPWRRIVTTSKTSFR